MKNYSSMICIVMLTVILVVPGFTDTPVKNRVIRNIKFEPKKNINISNNFQIDIPETWKKSSVPGVKRETLAFSDSNRQFGATLMIMYTADSESSFDEVVKFLKSSKFKDGKSTEIPESKKNLDTKADKKTFISGPGYVAGDTLVGVMHYPDLKMTMQVVVMVVYVEPLTEQEHAYVIDQGKNIIFSFKKIAGK